MLTNQWSLLFTRFQFFSQAILHSCCRIPFLSFKVLTRCLPADANRPIRAHPLYKAILATPSYNEVFLIRTLIGLVLTIHLLVMFFLVLFITFLHVMPFSLSSLYLLILWLVISTLPKSTLPLYRPSHVDAEFWNNIRIRQWVTLNRSVLATFRVQQSARVSLELPLYFLEMVQLIRGYSSNNALSVKLSEMEITKEIETCVPEW